MTAREWRQLGYRTIFRDGRIHLYRSATQELWTAPLELGLWIYHDDLRRLPWSAEAALSPGLQLVVRDCYCDRSCGTCAFCIGARAPHSAGCECPWHRTLCQTFCSAQCRASYVAAGLTRHLVIASPRCAFCGHDADFPAEARAC